MLLVLKSSGETLQNTTSELCYSSLQSFSLVPFKLPFSDHLPTCQSLPLQPPFDFPLGLAFGGCPRARRGSHLQAQQEGRGPTLSTFHVGLCQVRGAASARGLVKRVTWENKSKSLLWHKHSTALAAPKFICARPQQSVVQLRMFCDSAGFKWTQLCNKIRTAKL